MRGKGLPARRMGTRCHGLHPDADGKCAPRPSFFLYKNSHPYLSSCCLQLMDPPDRLQNQVKFHPFNPLVGTSGQCDRDQVTVAGA